MLKTLIIIGLSCCALFLIVFALCKPFRDFLLTLYKKNKELVDYIVVGVMTTAVCYIVLFIFYSLLNVRIEISNAISWCASVIFSFIMNKIVVFKSKGKDSKTLIREFGSFVGARALSGVLDEVLVIVGCNVLNINVYIVKLISEIFVIIINYFFSKFIIFKKK